MLHLSYAGLEDKEEIDPKLEPPCLGIQSHVYNNYSDECDKLHHDKIQEVFITKANF